MADEDLEEGEISDDGGMEPDEGVSSQTIPDHGGGASLIGGPVNLPTNGTGIAVIFVSVDLLLLRFNN